MQKNKNKPNQQETKNQTKNILKQTQDNIAIWYNNTA